MAFYYVKNGGTATGDAGRATTQRTGTFAAMGASAYYNDVLATLSATTVPNSGDFICCSNVHVAGYAATVTLSFTNDDITIISVDDSNAENYLSGARENTTSGDMRLWGVIGGRLTIQGLSVEAEDDITFANAGALVICKECEMRPNATGSAAAGDNLLSAGDGVRMKFIDCSFYPAQVSTASMFTLSNGCFVEIIGGSKINQTTDAKYLGFLNGAGGSTLVIDGFDTTNFNDFELIDNVSATVDDNNIIIAKNCKFPSTWTLGEPPNTEGTVYDIQNCDDGNNRSISAYRDRTGQMISNNSIYANGADQVEGQNVSLEIQTESITENSISLRFKIGSVRADFSTPKTVSIEIVHDALGSGTASRFQNDELWIDVHRPNSGDPAFIIDSSGLSDPFQTATTNASSSETWTGTSMTSETTETVSVSTTTGGGTGWADVYVNVSVASIGLGDLFISPDIQIS